MVMATSPFLKKIDLQWAAQQDPNSRNRSLKSTQISGWSLPAPVGVLRKHIGRFLLPDSAAVSMSISKAESAAYLNRERLSHLIKKESLTWPWVAPTCFISSSDFCSFPGTCHLFTCTKLGMVLRMGSSSMTPQCVRCLLLLRVNA